MKLLLPAIWLIAVSSLVLNIVLIKIGGSSPAFYLFPTRGWELAAGALVALHSASGRKLPAPVGMRWFALGLIIFGLIYTGPLPAGMPVAVPVVIGTSLLIYTGAPVTSTIGRVLAWWPVNRLGLISYSLYLWHWPVIVLTKYYFINDLTVMQLVMVGIASVILGYLSWRYVEKPFREKTMRFPKVGWTALLGSAAMAGLAGIFILTSGLPNRLNPKAAEINLSVGNNYRCPINEMQAFGASRACDLTLTDGSIDDSDAVLVGNSHAQMYAPLVKRKMQEAGSRGFLVPLNACLPTTVVNISESCRQSAERNLTEIAALQNVDTVIVGFDWSLDHDLFAMDGSAVKTSDAQALVDGLRGFADRLPNRRIVVIGPILTPGYDIASVLGRQIAFGRSDVVALSSDADPFYDEFSAALSQLESDPQITLIRPDRAQCIGATCDFVRGNLSLFADSNHLAERALDVFEPAFRDLFAEAQ